MKSKYKGLLSASSTFILGLAAILPSGCNCGGYRDVGKVIGCSVWGMYGTILFTGVGSLVGLGSDEAGEGAVVGAAAFLVPYTLAIWLDQLDERSQQGKAFQTYGKEAEPLNHNPIAAFEGDASKDVVELSASPGEVVRLSATGSSDPDGDQLFYRWWQERELGSFRQAISISNYRACDASFVAPSVSAPRTIHLTLMVSDDGRPSLYTRRRIIVTVKPQSKVEPLSDGRADVEAESNVGYRALYAATSRNSWEVVESLLAKGADVNAKNDVGRTCLYLAVEKGYKEMTETLIANGADVNAQDGQGRTALSIALKAGNEGMAKSLRKHGASE